MNNSVFRFKSRCSTGFVLALGVLYNMFFVNVGNCQSPEVSTIGSNGQFLDIGGCKIFYEEAGKGQCIVLLHDGLVNSMTWDGEWESLSKNFRVIRYDRRGYGRSDTPTKAFSQVSDLKTLLDHLNIKHASLVGCSSGGGTAIDFTIAHPEMVDHLILTGSVLHGMVTTSDIIQRGNRNNEPVKKNDLLAAAHNWAYDPTTIASADSVGQKKLYQALSRYPNNLKYTGQYELRPSSPAVTRLSEIYTPTLILVGEFDVPDVHSFSGAIQAGIPGSRREIVKGTAHLIPLERPEYLSERISDFIGKYPRVTAPPEVLDSYQGKYSIWGSFAIVMMKQGHLVIRFPAEWDIPLFQVSSTRFRCFLWSQDAEIEFEKNSTGQIVEATIYSEDGQSTKCKRL